jgi:toxin ParE1/3/4
VIIEYHPLTASDLNSAVAHHNDRQPGLGDRQRSEVYAAIERIGENPQQYPTIERGIRRSLVHRFPYSVLFRIVNRDSVQILVIRHHRRHPRLGLARR